MLDLITFLQAHKLPITTAPKTLKIHLASHDSIEHPLDVFKAGKFKEWQENQSKKYFECPQAIGLIDFSQEGGKHSWLFAGVYRVLGVQPHPIYSGNFLYSTELLPDQDDLIGRVVVHHKRSGQASYLWYTPHMQLTVQEFRAKRDSLTSFPGFDKVVLTHQQLQQIITHHAEDWYAPLKNVKGIYLITDTQTGKHYVGQANGADGIWQRWNDYAKTGHGNNVQLKALLDEKGVEYAHHFQYSILETMPVYAEHTAIYAREQHWIRVLHTRQYGLN